MLTIQMMPKPIEPDRGNLRLPSLGTQKVSARSSVATQAFFHGHYVRHFGCREALDRNLRPATCRLRIWKVGRGRPVSRVLYR